MSYDVDENGFVYCWTNKINGKMYIGSHNGKKKNYIGSGLSFLDAVKKYGIENFERDILYQGPDFRKVEDRILKEVDAARSNEYYNQKNEAMGGAFHGQRNGMFGKKHSSESRFRCGSSNRGKKLPEISQRMSGEKNPMFGRNDHTHGLTKRMREIDGKTWEEIYGDEKASQMRIDHSLCLTGKSHKLQVVQCPYCNLEGRGPNMTRYHFDKCKKRYQEEI